MRKHIATAAIVLLCALPLTLPAQSRVEFNRKEHNFGTIEEADGDVHCAFVIKNISASPIIISRVRSSCSCLTAKYSRKPIAANGTDTVRVTFDPRFRAGVIQKNISVYISGDSIPTTLSLKGYVSARE